MTDAIDNPDSPSFDPLDDDRSRTRTAALGLGIGVQPPTGLLGISVGGYRQQTGSAAQDQSSVHDDRRRRESPQHSSESRTNSRIVRTTPGPSRSDDYHVEAYRYGDEVMVLADLPGVTVDDLSVKHDANSSVLVLSVTGVVVSRVALPWDHVDVSKAWFNNGILELRVRPSNEVDVTAE